MRVLVERTLLGRSRLLSTSAKFHYTSIAWSLSVSTLVLFCCDYAACTSTDNSRNASTEIGVLQSGKQTTGMLSTSLNNDTQHCNCSKACLLRKYHLTFCQKIELDKIVDRLAQQFNRTTCLRHFTSLVKENDRARREFKKFDDIMGRVDCTSKYSVRWNCSDCLEAYKEWICETFFAEALAHLLPDLKPNSSCSKYMCGDVIRKCPYLLPDTENQYSGQPVFDCETGEGEKKCWTKFSSESDPTLLSSTAGAGNQTAAQGNDSLKDDDSVS